jgi:hypothetical protein
VLVSCTDKGKIPAGVLAKDKMEKVLWDMIQAERFRETFIRDSSKDLKSETFKLYAQVFKIHKVSKDEFIKSYKFYMSRPDIARDMFDSLATKANRRREELYKPKSGDTTKVQQTDTAKLHQQPAIRVKADSAKIVPAQSALPTPVLPPPVKPNFRNRRPMLDRFKFDSLRQLRFQPKKTS